MSEKPVSQASGPLIDRPTPFEGELLFQETKTLFRSVRLRDFETLAALCDDDFGIVDLGPQGESVLIRSRAEWEAWFRSLFAKLEAMGADTDTRIDNYQVRMGSDMALSVVEFCQTLAVGDQVGLFDCVATIVWKRTPQGWREARWHASLIRHTTAKGEALPR